jgi:hypothetical protein
MTINLRPATEEAPNTTHKAMKVKAFIPRNQKQKLLRQFLFAFRSGDSICDTSPTLLRSRPCGEVTFTTCCSLEWRLVVVEAMAATRAVW